MKDNVRGSGKRLSLLVGILGSALLAVLVMLAGRTDLLWELELKTYDARFIWRGPLEVDSSDIVIVAIDDESYATLGSRWPFPRQWYARAIHNLFSAGARLLVFDVQFDMPDDPRGDSLLAAATAEYSDRIIHAGKIVYQEDERIDKALTQLVEPSELIRSHQTHLGIVNEAQDRDGFTRRYYLYIEHNGLNYLPLALKAFQIVKELPDTGYYRDDPRTVNFGGHIIPRLTEETMLTNFYGPAATFSTYSLAAVLDDAEFDLFADDTDYMQWFLMSDEEFAVMESALPEESVNVFREIRQSNPFKDKYVFLGASVAELRDNKKTPFYTYSPPGKKSHHVETPGVEVHANAFQTLLDNNYLRNVSPVLETLLVFLLALVVFFINNNSRLATGTIITILLGIAVTVIITYLFVAHRVWVAQVTPVMSIAIAYVGTTTYRFILEQKEKAMIRGMFSQYVPQKVVNELIANPDLLKLGGEKRRMTVLFMDIVGFTSVSESLSPDELVALLNEYLSQMSQIVLDNDGIIDKYEGDLIMAEWGAPVFFEHHAVSACSAALKMQQRLAGMRETWRERGMPQLHSRIGINSGEMVVGNMGCLEVFDYTVMGDAVNLASRLEGANKTYGSSIMIGPETHDGLPDHFVTRMLDDIRVKGKTEPVRVYELLAEFPDDLSPEKHESLELFRQGTEHYREMRFTEGRQLFEKVLSVDPVDGASKTYLERCKFYAENPPSGDWDRIFSLTIK